MAKYVANITMIKQLYTFYISLACESKQSSIIISIIFAIYGSKSSQPYSNNILTTQRYTITRKPIILFALQNYMLLTILIQKSPWSDIYSISIPFKYDENESILTKVKLTIIKFRLNNVTFCFNLICKWQKLNSCWK